MVLVEGDKFTMGATIEQVDNSDSGESPAHCVILSDYYIGETPVTQELWQAVMGGNPCYFKGPHLPVESVSWNACEWFISKLNESIHDQLDGKRFHLPFEAQWEFAARGGKKSNSTKYAGSSNINDVAWHIGNSDNHTHEVKKKVPNELGLYDMSGNVWEWCQDRYGEYRSELQTNPTGPSSGVDRVLRGGCWMGNPTNSRVSSRRCSSPSGTSSAIGLRLALY